MITKNEKNEDALSIFENFQIDKNLPKHIKPDDSPYKDVTINWAMASGVINSGGGTQFRFSIINWIKGLFKKSKNYIDNKRAIPVEQIFEAVMGSGKKLEVVQSRLDVYRKSIEKSKNMGQIALAEQLEEKLSTVEIEAVLVATENVQYIEEFHLIDFALKCERGLCLDWIKNFTRVIPHKIAMKKLKFDVLQVFDNYVVLHYDPNNKNNSLTKKEIEKKKDPILFGVIKGSRRLYHVGSWKDEHCNLTFDDLIEKYGEDVLTLE